MSRRECVLKIRRKTSCAGGGAETHWAWRLVARCRPARRSPSCSIEDGSAPLAKRARGRRRGAGQGAVRGEGRGPSPRSPSGSDRTPRRLPPSRRPRRRRRRRPSRPAPPRPAQTSVRLGPRASPATLRSRARCGRRREADPGGGAPRWAVVSQMEGGG